MGLSNAFNYASIDYGIIFKLFCKNDSSMVGKGEGEMKWKSFKL